MLQILDFFIGHKSSCNNFLYSLLLSCSSMLCACICACRHASDNSFLSWWHLGCLLHLNPTITCRMRPPVFIHLSPSSSACFGWNNSLRLLHFFKIKAYAHTFLGVSLSLPYFCVYAHHHKMSLKGIYNSTSSARFCFWNLFKSKILQLKKVYHTIFLVSIVWNIHEVDFGFDFFFWTFIIAVYLSFRLIYCRGLKQQKQHDNTHSCPLLEKNTDSFLW